MNQPNIEEYAPSEIELFLRIEKALTRKGQVILFGPPGTGKTYSANRFIKWKNSNSLSSGLFIYMKDKVTCDGLFNGNIQAITYVDGGSTNLTLNSALLVCEYEDYNLKLYGIGKLTNLLKISDGYPSDKFDLIGLNKLNTPIDITHLMSTNQLETLTKNTYNFFLWNDYGSMFLDKIIDLLKYSDREVYKLLKSVEMCTFHPSYGYEDFIESYRPLAIKEQPSVESDKSVSDSISFRLTDGVFKNFTNNITFSSAHYFIIDEINRGNVSKIFGELITIIEQSKRGNEVILPQSKEQFSVPENLYIIGTMNTSDRSIKMMDAALKRRFAFIEVMPDLSVINENIDGLNLSPADILRQLNEKLISLIGRDKQIGHAYFMKDDQQITDLEDLRDIYDMDIIPLVQEYCYDDYNLLADIVGKSFLVEKNGQIMPEINRDALDGDIDKFIRAIKEQFGSHA